MSWAIGYDSTWNRDIGYGVPAVCDHPKCDVKIDRGLSNVCGGEAFGGEHGCGLFFCSSHLYFRKPRYSAVVVQFCKRCFGHNKAYTPKPDLLEWVKWKLTDDSWARWRDENAEEVARLRQRLPEGAAA